MDQPHDAGMLVALAAGPGTRIAVIDRFVHRDGTLYLAAESTAVGSNGAVDAGLLRTETSASGSKLLTVRTSTVGIAERRITDVPVPRSYEAVLDAALLAEGDGLILRSELSWIILTRTEVKSALTRRRRMAQRAAAGDAESEV